MDDGVLVAEVPEVVDPLAKSKTCWGAGPVCSGIGGGSPLLIVTELVELLSTKGTTRFPF